MTSSPLPSVFQDVGAVCGRAGDHLFRWERLLHLLQQPALAQPLSVGLQAPGPGAGPAPREPASVPDVSTDDGLRESVTEMISYKC